MYPVSQVSLVPGLLYPFGGARAVILSRLGLELVRVNDTHVYRYTCVAR